jgi:cell division protein FtsL
MKMQQTKVDCLALRGNSGRSATGATHRRSSAVTDRRYKKGSAVVVVLVLAFVMGAVISDNGLVLHQLKQEMQLIEKKQIRQHEERLKKLRKQTTENTTLRGIGEIANTPHPALSPRPTRGEGDRNAFDEQGLARQPFSKVCSGVPSNARRSFIPLT